MNPESNQPESVQTQPSRKSTTGIAIAIIIIIILAIVGYMIHSRSSGGTVASWTPYTQKYYGISLQYPAGWNVVDELSPNTCCLFLLNYKDVSATSSAAAGTIKLQVGYYETATFDPFKIGSTTQITLGGKTVYKGANAGTPFYIVPKSPTEGAGIAIFSDKNTLASADKIAEQIISSMSFVATSTATSTAPVSTSTKK